MVRGVCDEFDYLKNSKERWGDLRQNLAAVAPILLCKLVFSATVLIPYVLAMSHETVVFPELD
jgi:hypothetical protein